MACKSCCRICKLTGASPFRVSWVVVPSVVAFPLIINNVVEISCSISTKVGPDLICTVVDANIGRILEDVHWAQLGHCAACQHADYKELQHRRHGCKQLPADLVGSLERRRNQL